jgi:hypothetical protein
MAMLLPLHAQTAGRLSGSVVDQSGAAVPNAKISLYLHGGNKPLISTQTTSDGLFSIGTLRAESYDISVEASGFNVNKLVEIKIDVAAETSLPPIKMQVASSSQSVQVTESAASVNTTNIEVNQEITKEQLDALPALDRQVSTLFLTQPGVTEAAGDAVVNGMRTTSTNVTYDGVNIQDNLIRLNSLDFLPNRITLDQVQEVTINASNANPAMGNGASQVVLVTPSGTNHYHGSLYWYYRNDDLAADDWFSNQSGVKRAPLNLNQFGGTLGGPIKKDKLFFYFNTEVFREVTSSPTDETVLTPAARAGILTYRNTGGAIQQLNVLNAANLSADSTVASLLNQIPLPNNNNVGDGLNTSGYEVNEPFNENRKTFSGKIDYYLNQKNVIAGSFNYNTDSTLRPDGLLAYYGGPVGVNNADAGKLLSASWRSTITSRLTNELRGGFNLAALPFNVTGTQPADYLTSGLVGLPGIDWALFPQGRNSKVFTLQDNATYVRGKHTISFGYQSYILHEQPYAPNGNVVPNYALGISAAAPFQFSANNIPGTSATYIAAGNNLLSTLGGIIGSYSQEYNITSQTSGFVPNAISTHNNVENTYSGYVADNYKLFRHLTLSAGVRYDYWTPVYDSQGLYLTPTLQNNNPIATILNPNGGESFQGNPGNTFYNSSKMNFSPNAGFAWDIFGDGKTSLRGGYSLAFFNDDTILSVIDSAGTNAGTSLSVANNNAYNLVRNGLPATATPVFNPNQTFAENYALNSANGQAIINPNLKTPYYQQFNLGVERQVRKVLFDVRYVGNHGTRLYQGFDENQVQINSQGFLQDFQNAQSNANLSQAAGHGYLPAFNPAIAGSVPLPVFAKLSGGGLLTNGTVINDIQQGVVGTLAQVYQEDGLNGGVNFFQNPNELLGRLLTNYANSTYNALQTEARGKVTKDLQFQFSYVFSKVLTDSPGIPQGNINDLLALNNGAIERGRASFDVTQVFKLNYVYTVPLGKGHRFMTNRYANSVLGGWTTSGFLTHQSGNPFSVLDPLGTYNRGARSTFETANISGITKSQLNQVIGGQTYVNGNGVYFVNPSILSAAGQGVPAFGAAPYAGGIFSNPTAGTVGNLQLREFSGPWATNMNISLQKTFRLFESNTLQLRADFNNVFNHASFEPSNDGANSSVQSTTFGKSPGDLYGPRVIQLALHYRF